MAAPLDGVRVLDLTGGVAGPHATKLLADYGADVVKVEPPEGDRSRRWGPFKDDVPHRETSAPFLWLNTSKRSIVADLETREGVALVRRLAARSDVIVEDLAPGRLPALGLDLGALRRERRELVTCSITPFGQDGPYAALPESDLVLQAMGGAMYATGHAEREPLRLAGHYALWHAGLAAAYAIALALLRAEESGEGDAVDVAIYETQAGGKDRRQLTLLAHAYTGAIARRRDAAFALASGVRPCVDGYINLLGGQRLPVLLRMVGRPDLAQRSELHLPGDEMPADLVDEIEAAYLGWTLQHTMREALRIAQEHRILGGTVQTVADALADPTFRERGAWERIEHPVAGSLDYPGRPFLMTTSPRRPARRAPLLDEHREEVRAELAGHSPRRRGRATGARQELPLAGVRVIDLAVVWAGPFATQLLAEWGAEVIKMEPITIVQPQTRPIAVNRSGWFAGDDSVDLWNRGVNFNCSGLDKRSFTGDLRTPEGREAFLRLVAISDVVVENNVPETVERLGITYEALRDVNPRIIFVRMPGFGLSGEYASYRCWGNHLEGMAGHLTVRAYPDATPDAAGETYACDSVAGLTAAVATVMALRHRARTGEGQQVEVPQIEAFMGLLGVEYLDYQLNGRVATTIANDHRTHAPHNVYLCAPRKDGGEDRWIAIDVEDDGQWRALLGVLGAHSLGEDVRFATQRSRWQHRRALDRELARLIAPLDRGGLFRALVAAGVPAGPVQDDADCFRCHHLRARGWFEPTTREDIGTYDYPGRLFRLGETPAPPRRPPPRLGEDNEYVYRTLLGYSDEEYRALLESGQVGTRFTEEALARART